MLFKSDVCGSMRFRMGKNRSLSVENKKSIYVTKTGMCGKKILTDDPLAFHYPIRVSTKERRECFWCRVCAREAGEASARRRTTFKCRLCDVFLCIEQNRHCFKEMHSS